MADRYSTVCCICGAEFSVKASDAKRGVKSCSVACGHIRRIQTNAISLRDRIEKRIARPADGGCWNWAGALGKTGYGMINVAGKTKAVHRVMYELASGEIPEGLEIRHKCDNPRCCNPQHLEVGTHSQNMGDMRDRGRKYAQALSAGEVIEIRRQYLVDGMKQLDLAAIYGVSKSAISSAIRGKNWQHLGVPSEYELKAASNRTKARKLPNVDGK